MVVVERAVRRVTLLWGWKPQVHAPNGALDDDHRPENLRVLSIDNAGAFQYKAPHQYSSRAHGDEDHLAHYFMDSGGISSLGKFGMAPWDNEHAGHATEWWQENSPFIR